MSAGTASYRVSTAQVFSATAQSANANTEMGNEANVYIKASAAGTTFTATIQCSPDGGTTWFTHTTLSAITDTTGVLTKLTGNIGKLMRINYGTVTGSFTVDAWIETKRGSV